jgi:hypothetical protein
MRNYAEINVKRVPDDTNLVVLFFLFDRFHELGSEESVCWRILCADGTKRVGSLKGSNSLGSGRLALVMRLSTTLGLETKNGVSQQNSTAMEISSHPVPDQTREAFDQGPHEFDLGEERAFRARSVADKGS